MDTQRFTRCGFGVLELAARFSMIGLDEGSVHGEIERDDTFGLSWHPDTNLRIMTDHVHSHAAPPALDADT